MPILKETLDAFLMDNNLAGGVSARSGYSDDGVTKAPRAL
jgi:hypothetical protein